MATAWQGDWVRTVKVGDEVHLFGPRASLDLAGISAPVVVLGDETSIGLTYALQRHDPERAVLGLLEVNAAANAQAALTRLGIGTVALFQRQADDAHLELLEQRLAELVGTQATFVLTGKAPTIQRLRRTLKALGTPAARLPTKAYWAPGKRGLD